MHSPLPPGLFWPALVLHGSEPTMATLGTQAREHEPHAAQQCAESAARSRAWARRFATERVLADPALLWSRGEFAACVLAFCAITSLILASGVEWEHYRRVLRWQAVPMTLLDRPLLLWLLWSKTLVLLLPAILPGILACWLKRRRAAYWILSATWAIVFFWLGIDLWLHRWLGSHLTDYLPYVHDVVAGGIEANHKEWAGDTSVLVQRAAAILALVVGGGWTIWRGCVVLWPLLARFGVCRGRSLAAATGLCAVGLAGVAVVPMLHSQPLLLRRLEGQLPIDVAIFSPASPTLQEKVRAWLGLGGPARQSGVRIVAMLPDPPGPDTGRERIDLHNFGPGPIDLDGWALVDISGKRLALSGILRAGETRRVRLPAGTITLDDWGDEVLLVDAQGQVPHRAAYTSDDVKYGALVPFGGSADLNAFLELATHRAQKIYEERYQRMMQAQPIDQAAVVHKSGLPNVVLIVLESFRHVAVGPGLMERIDRWAQAGLRCRTHYAGSNSSHLGLFTLLYGRSSLLYDVTLDAGVPPQLPWSLRASGYECSFITSGDCTGFRRMDGYLNRQVFDRLEVKWGSGWRDWPERDQAALEDAQRLARERPGGKPQFIMLFLMCTHVPYAYPPEFELRRPAAQDVAGDAWRNCEPAHLQNRYANAALFLEDRIMRLIEALDPSENLIIITGDHGESLGEDGALCHGTRASDIQTRVPLVMVGPGVPAREIFECTTHADVPATVLHALAGRPVHLAHGHGRDLLAGTVVQEPVLLCPYRWRQPYDLVLLHGGQRLHMRIRIDRPQIEVFGFHDQAGDIDLSSAHRYSAADAPVWCERFAHTLDRVLR